MNRIEDWALVVEGVGGQTTVWDEGIEAWGSNPHAASSDGGGGKGKGK